MGRQKFKRRSISNALTTMDSRSLATTKRVPITTGASQTRIRFFYGGDRACLVTRTVEDFAGALSSLERKIGVQDR
jgi:hypothetical protein